MGFRDLKPDNVLLAGGEESVLPAVKLADFGVSLLMAKVRTAPLSRLTTLQVNAVVDPLEESTEVSVPWDAADSDEMDLDGLVQQNTAEIQLPPTRLPARYNEGAFVIMGAPPVDDSAPTIEHPAAPANPAAVLNKPVASTITAAKPPAADSLGVAHEASQSGVGDAVTQSGILIGTPMYMAPELWHSGSHLAQPSSDLFSFGVIAFELLTSVLPFVQPPVFATAQKQPLRIPKLGGSRSELAAPLCALVDACLAENPALRPTAQVVAVQLRELGAPTPY